MTHPGARQDVATDRNLLEGDNSKTEIPEQTATPEDRFLALITGQQLEDDQPAEQESPVEVDATPEPEPETEPDEETTPDDQPDEESTDEPAPEEEEATEASYVVTVDGKDETVLASELVQGYQRDRDYRNKTQTLADDRKSFEQQQLAVTQERQRYDQLLGQLETTLKAQAEGPDAQAMEELRKTDPAEYAALAAEQNQRLLQLQQVETERQTVAEQQRQDTVKAFERQVADERVRLIEKVPEWKDSVKAQEEQALLNQYGETQGFTTDELAQVVDHRAVVILRKAMLYDQLQQTKKTVVRKARRAPTMKPGASGSSRPKPVNPMQTARTQLKKTGHVRDAADAFFQLLNEP